MLQSMIAGNILGFALIIAIGAQNAFVLRAGLRRAHVFWVCLTCALSDAVLIAFGVASLGSILDAVPGLETAMRWGGAAFLLGYALKSFWAALKKQSILEAQGEAGTLKGAIITCLLLTWLNPHVYIDTVLLLGAVSQNYPSQFWFAIGAMTASVLFFFSLGYGARMLSPIFAQRRAWQILEFSIGVVMVIIAWSLLSS